jgi:hypothetical protein
MIGNDALGKDLTHALKLFSVTLVSTATLTMLISDISMITLSIVSLLSAVPSSIFLGMKY